MAPGSLASPAAASHQARTDIGLRKQCKVWGGGNRGGAPVPHPPLHSSLISMPFVILYGQLNLRLTLESGGSGEGRLLQLLGGR